MKTKNLLTSPNRKVLYSVTVTIHQSQTLWSPSALKQGSNKLDNFLVWPREVRDYKYLYYVLLTSTYFSERE